VKLCTLLVLASLAGPVSATPVHVALKSAAVVSPNVDGFFTLASVADLTGGDPIFRARLSLVDIGRAPLCGEARHLTLGDLALKLRQAGFDPEKDTVLEGAGEADVTTVGAGITNPVGAMPVNSVGAGPVSAPAPTVDPPLVHFGSPVTILIQSGALTITAPGIAEESGRAGDYIRVHREGVMTNLTVTVLDKQTVRLEI